MFFLLFLRPISLLCLCVFCVSLPNFKECLSENKITTHHYNTWSKTVLSYFRVLLLVYLTPLSHFNVLRCFKKKKKEKLGYESRRICKDRSKTYFRVLLQKVCVQNVRKNTEIIGFHSKNVIGVFLNPRQWCWPFFGDVAVINYSFLLFSRKFVASERCISRRVSPTFLLMCDLCCL